MTAQPMRANEELSVPGDYVPGVRGYAILVTGRDGGTDGDGDGGGDRESFGAESIAVWRLGATGYAAGAWILRLDDIEADPQHLRDVMSLLRDRCLVDWDADRPEAALRRIERWLSADLVSALRSNLLFIPDLLHEVRKHRRVCSETVEQHRLTTKSAIVPLAWSVELPDDPDRARRMLTPAPMTATPVAAEALALAGTVRRAVELWQDTEQTRYRRTYLRSLGEVQPLPPRWLAALRKAGGTSTVAEVA